MLLIPHHVAPSPLSGCGVFCDVAVRAGEVVYRCDPFFMVTITHERIASLPPGMVEEVRKYGYDGRGKDHLDDGLYLCTDDSRFMNHSDRPSLAWRAEEECYVAARDLPHGTELTCDYNDFCTPGIACFGFAKPDDGDDALMDRPALRAFLRDLRQRGREIDVDTLWTVATRSVR